MDAYNPQELGPYSKGDRVHAFDQNEIIRRLKRLESISVAAPLILDTSDNGFGIGIDPDFFSGDSDKLFVELTQDFGTNDLRTINGNKLEAKKLRQDSNKSYSATNKTVNFVNLLKLNGKEGNKALLIKFTEKFKEWILVAIRPKITHKWVTIDLPLDGEDIEVDITDPDNEILTARNWFQFTNNNYDARALVMLNATLSPFSSGFSSGFDSGDEWRIVQISNPCL